MRATLGAARTALRIPPWRPNYLRSGLNHLEEPARQYVSRWDSRVEMNDYSWQISRSRFGNLNVGGSPGDHVAPSLTPADPGFADAIEPGCRPLVLWFVQRGFVTYSSCEGHRYEGIDLPPVERHVGVLPRDQAELAALEQMLGRVARSSRWRLRAARPAVFRFSITDGEGTHPTVDLVLRRSWGATWNAYFRALDRVCEQLKVELGSMA